MTVSAVKPLLNHLLEKILMAENVDTDLTKEMKERIKVDLRYLDSGFDHLLELSSFLDPRFKLNYVNYRAKDLKETENEMSELIECPVDDATTTSSPLSSSTSESLLTQ